MTPRTPSLVLLLGTAGALVAFGCFVWILFRHSGAGHVSARTRTPATAVQAPKLEYAPTAIGAPLEEFGRPQVTSLQLVDLDGDGLRDVLYCESVKHSVRWIRQAPRGVFNEVVIGERIAAPGHVAVADVNHSGRLDVLVASMGKIMPSNEQIGAVVVLENLDNRTFHKRVLLENVARVSDVRAGNLAGHDDGRLDLVVGQFGYDQGETRWLENKGDWQVESRSANNQSGCIHTPVADFDGDGRMDFAALISQEWEEVHLFRNLGNRQFQDTIVWGSTNEDYGSSGLELADVNGDGSPIWSIPMATLSTTGCMVPGRGTESNGWKIAVPEISRSTAWAAWKEPTDRRPAT